MSSIIDSLRAPREPKTDRFVLGADAIDTALGGGLARGDVHEIVAAPGHPVAAIGFAAALAWRAAKRPSHEAGVVWLRQEASAIEAGGVYGPGLASLGLSPDRLALVTLRSATDLLRAGLDVARCSAVGAAILETTDTGRLVDLTATRRLLLAAERSGVTVLLVRTAGQSGAGAAQTRWQVGAACSPACLDAPWLPWFEVVLLRQRGGVAGLGWCVEWNHEHGVFRQAISRAVDAVPVRRPRAA